MAETSLIPGPQPVTFRFLAWKSKEKTPERPEEILDDLDQMIRNAKPIPLTDQVRVDARRLQTLHDQLRQPLGLAPPS